jgi:hypothetical protein
MRLLDLLVGISPVLLGLAAALLVAVALLQPRHVPARSATRLREVQSPR